VQGGLQVRGISAEVGGEVKSVAVQEPQDRERGSLFRRNLILIGGYFAILTLIATAYL
jgi:hypothetical protein